MEQGAAAQTQAAPALAVLTSLVANLRELHRSGSKEANVWLEAVRDAASWEDAVSLWNIFHTIGASSCGMLPTELVVVRFFLAQLLSSKVATSRDPDKAVWLLGLSECELRTTGDAAARHLAVASVKFVIRTNRVPLFETAVKSWIDGAQRAGQAEVAVQMLSFLAEVVQEASAVDAGRHSGNLRCDVVRSMQESHNAFSPEMSAALCAALPVIITRLLHIAVWRNDGSRVHMPSDELKQSAFRGIDHWLSVLASDAAFNLHVAESVLGEAARTPTFAQLMDGVGSGDVELAATLTSFAELAVKITQCRQGQEQSGADIFVRQAAAIALMWWRRFCDHEAAARELDAGAVVRWCALVSSLGPQLLDLGMLGERLLLAMTDILMRPSRWTCSVRGASLEAWSSLVRPRDSGADDRLLHLHRGLTRALLMGLRSGAEHPDVLSRLRDQAAGLLAEWTRATGKDFSFEVAVSALEGAGQGDWQEVEAALHLLSIAGPQVCRTGSAGEVAAFGEQFLRFPEYLLWANSKGETAVRLRMTMAAVALQWARALSIKKFTLQGVDWRVQQRLALETALDVLGSDVFLSPFKTSEASIEFENRRFTRDALRRGAAAICALATEGSWLDTYGVLEILVDQMHSRHWLPEADPMFVHAYCNIIALLPDEGALQALDCFCNPLLEAMTSSRQITLSNRKKLRLLLAALRFAPPRVLDDGEPCALKLLSKVWFTLGMASGSFAASVVPTSIQGDILLDMVGVIRAYSEISSVREYWLPRFAEALARLGAPYLKFALSAARGLFEAYYEEGARVAHVLRELMKKLLTAAEHELRRGYLSVNQQEVLLGAALDLADAANRFDRNMAAGIVTGLHHADATRWASLGLSQLGQAHCPVFVRSIMGYCSTLTALEPETFLTAVIRILARPTGSPAFCAHPTLAASFASPVASAARLAVQRHHGRVVFFDAAGIDGYLARRFESLCESVANGTITVANLARDLLDIAGVSDMPGGATIRSAGV